MTAPSNTAHRVYDIAIKTPLERAVKISIKTGRDVHLKREDLQPVHSFKLRGAYNKMAQLTDTEQAKGVIAASAGNHAQGVALAAKRLGIDALIVMPRTTPHIKVDAVKGYGATVELLGDNYSEAAEYCKARTAATGRTYIHPFDDPLVIAGQGTVGQEIIEQLPDTTHIFVPVGGGGLIAGIAQYVKTRRPDIKIISVEPADSNALQRSIAENERVVLPYVGIFADGVAVKQIGERSFAIARQYVDDYITVTTDQICAGVKSIYEDTRSIVEPAGALAVAGIATYNLPKGAQAVAVCSGANMTFERLQQVVEQTRLGSEREALIAVTVPHTPDALLALCKNGVAKHPISELSYRFDGRTTTHALLGVTFDNSADKQALFAQLQTTGYTPVDLSDDSITRGHTQYMIGGHTVSAAEHVYEVRFPEQPGALTQLLTTIGTTWPIRLFHYKATASDTGSVVVGIEAKQRKALEAALGAGGMIFHLIDANDGVARFLR